MRPIHRLPQPSFAAFALAAAAVVSVGGCRPAPAPGDPPDPAAAASRPTRSEASPEAPAIVARLLAARAHVFEDAPALRSRDGWLEPAADDRFAAVALGPTAADGFRVTDRASGVSAAVRLLGARPAPVAVERGHAVYPGGDGGRGAVIARPVEAGVEDWVELPGGDRAGERTWSIELGEGVAGLRLVAGTLELIDGGGAPRLRMSRPALLDGNGRRHPAEVAVEGCAFDVDPAPPWGRAVVPPGARRCFVRVAWRDVPGAAFLDPLWTSTKGHLAYARTGHTATLLSTGMVLIAGGNSAANGPLVSSELYLPSGDTFAISGDLRAARTGHAAVLLADGRAMVAGGMDASGNALASAETWSGGVWTAIAPMATARVYHTASLTLVNGAAQPVVIGGDDTITGPLASAERYDPVANTWHTVANPMRAARESHVAVALANGLVLVCGGYDATGAAIASCEEYTSVFDAFSSEQPLANARGNAAGVALADGSIVIAGGFGGAAPVGAVERGAAAEPHRWSTVGTLASARGQLTATLLPTGQALFAGGDDRCHFVGCDPAVATADLYDPAGGLGPTGAMNVPRYGHTATLFAAGTSQAVLVVGGTDRGAELASAERFALLSQGAPCVRPTDCLAGYCVDGVCCDGACSGGCQVCAASLGAPADGTCTVAAVGVAGMPSCAPYVCDGVSPACPSACLADSGCASGLYCDASHACVPLQAIGANCTRAGECTSGFCVDGVCCNAACAGQCEACDLAGSVGTCAPAPAGPAPSGRPACTSDGSACGGACDGTDTASCHYPDATTSCRAGTCSGGSATAASGCDGAGHCPPPVVTACAPYACGASACLAACATDGDCVSGDYCDPAHHCAARQSNGSACTVAGGCVSGFCVDGVCCNAACTGQCESCDLPGSVGTCAPAPAGPAPSGRPACASDGSACGGTCDGMHRASCRYPDATLGCRAASCTNGAATASASCDGAGHCPAPAVTACAPYACGVDGACLAACATDSDCAPGSFCDAGHHCGPFMPPPPDLGAPPAPDLALPAPATDGGRSPTGPAAATGGCDVVGGRGSIAPWPPLALLALALLRGRRRRAIPLA